MSCLLACLFLNRSINSFFLLPALPPFPSAPLSALHIDQIEAIQSLDLPYFILWFWYYYYVNTTFFRMKKSVLRALLPLVEEKTKKPDNVKNTEVMGTL